MSSQAAYFKRYEPSFIERIFGRKKSKRTVIGRCVVDPDVKQKVLEYMKGDKASLEDILSVGNRETASTALSEYGSGERRIPTGGGRVFCKHAHHVHFCQVCGAALLTALTAKPMGNVPVICDRSECQWETNSRPDSGASEEPNTPVSSFYCTSSSVSSLPRRKRKMKSYRKCCCGRHQSQYRDDFGK